MTTQLTEEGWYRYQERLGILCADAEPTLAQHNMAIADAMAWDCGPGQRERRTREVTAPKQ